jgi:OTU domain-containing protein 6
MAQVQHVAVRIFEFLVSVRSISIMAKSKRNKLMKALGQSQPAQPTIDDDELMDDLLSQLDSRDQNVQIESATLIQEISGERKQDPKSRFQARQVH